MSLKAAASLFFSLAACAQAVEIRVATFNVEAHFTTSSGGVYYPDYSLGAPGSPDFDTVRDILDRIDADVVTLQEIHAVDISGNRVSALAGSLGYPHVYTAPSTNAFDTTLHVAFLSRFPFLIETAVGSPAGAREMNRLIPAVKVDVPGTNRDPMLLAAHLKSGTEASDLFQRTIELRRLSNHLTGQGFTANDNFLLMGDFNLSSNPRSFSSIPATGMPVDFDLGSDITFPISYFTDPTLYFTNPSITRILPRQLDNSTVTRPSSGKTIDVILASGIMGSRPLRTEIYNSVLDTSTSAGLPKAGAPLPAGTSATASDHLALFGDFELDPALPYALTAPGASVNETFAGFPGTYDPYPWTISGGMWRGTDDGSVTTSGFRSYGPPADGSLGFFPQAAAGSATASFVNHSAVALTSLEISYSAEQWRSALGGTADTISAELITGGVANPLPALTFQAATHLPAGAVAGGTSSLRSMRVIGLTVPPGGTFQLRFTFTPGAGGGELPADVFINEFHYDNVGNDINEFVEVVTGPGFTGSLANVSLLLFNGADGTSYASHLLSTFTAGALTASGHRIYSKLIPGIQNGSPDGFALALNGVATRFISYEGQIQATAGIANGMASTDIGLNQTGSEPAGESALGLTGTGDNPASFAWQKFSGIAHSPGQPNAGQTFVLPALPPQGIALDNLTVTFVADSDGDGATDAEEAVFGTNPLDANSRFSPILGRPSAAITRLTFPTLTGRTYTIEGSTQLTNWAEIVTYPGNGAQVFADLPVTDGERKRFYRIRVALP